MVPKDFSTAICSLVLNDGAAAGVDFIDRACSHDLTKLCSVGVCRPDLEAVIGVFAQRQVIISELSEGVTVFLMAALKANIARNGQSDLKSCKSLLTINYLSAVQFSARSSNLVENHGT